MKSTPVPTRSMGTSVIKSKRSRIGIDGDGGGFRNKILHHGNMFCRKPPPSPSHPVNGYHYGSLYRSTTSWPSRVKKARSRVMSFGSLGQVK